MTKERLQKAEKLIKFVQNDQKIAASESSNKDCLLILEQSERITELESAIQKFLEACCIIKGPQGFKYGYIQHHYDKFKQLLRKEKL